MRKTIIAGIGLAFSLVGIAGAQQPSQEGPARPKAERNGGRQGGFGRGDGLLFRDITLTDAQKAQLRTLRQSERVKMDAQRDARQKQMDEVRAARQRGDTAAVRTLMERNRAQFAQVRDQHVAAVRSILTAEQHVQFDKNVAELKQRDAERGTRFGPRGERGTRGPRGDRRAVVGGSARS